VCVPLNKIDLLLPAPIPEEGGAFTAHALDTLATTKLENVTQPKSQTPTPESDTDGETQDEVTTFRMQLDISKWLVDTWS